MPVLVMPRNQFVLTFAGVSPSPIPLASTGYAKGLPAAPSNPNPPVLIVAPPAARLTQVSSVKEVNPNRFRLLAVVPEPSFNPQRPNSPVVGTNISEFMLAAISAWVRATFQTRA